MILRRRERSYMWFDVATGNAVGEPRSLEDGIAGLLAYPIDRDIALMAFDRRGMPLWAKYPEDFLET